MERVGALCTIHHDRPLLTPHMAACGKARQPVRGMPADLPQLWTEGGAGAGCSSQALCSLAQPAASARGLAPRCSWVRRALSVDSSGRAVAQSMTVETPTRAAGSEEGSVRSACTVVAPQSRRKSAGLSRGRTMQRTCGAGAECGGAGASSGGQTAVGPQQADRPCACLPLSIVWQALKVKCHMTG